MSQHLGTNKNANALRRQLLKASIDSNACRSFEMIAYGPNLLAAASKAEHDPCRDLIGTMERALQDALHAAGYTVLNKVNCRRKLDDLLWRY